ncbi:MULTISPECIES: hypothetical protein [Bacillus cereus group]|uniref:Uncharacterized protein n=1 Tax=Bacillus thuringiensis serovar mexicanensis TaxID=180868 RepID=A0A242WFD5_BACTU|nr:MULTISPECIES: hypothetical protein [Bacillus cereus group]MEB9670116.1 hypothetical protein [Bacillus anthracis]OTW55665.1 hypothetical protein BK699_00600 [Bacillus thuringiensis serovar mexicanensis]OTX05516.1 hypothetical protein BK705_12040 [Bacillus thuringiensis serovar monterrey]HDR5270338.1 hypothetical protein [Bacillus thuringiensis]
MDFDLIVVRLLSISNKKVSNSNPVVRILLEAHTLFLQPYNLAQERKDYIQKHLNNGRRIEWCESTEIRIR